MKLLPLDDVDALGHVRDEKALLQALVGDLSPRGLRLNEWEANGLSVIIGRWQETLHHALETMNPEEKVEDQPGQA